MRPIIKYHGGKSKLAPWIIRHFPDEYENLNYWEPFCGAANVLLQKKRGTGKEWLSDVDQNIHSLLITIRDDIEGLTDRLSWIPYSETAFKKALEDLKNPQLHTLHEAVNTYVKFRMSRGGLGEDFAYSRRLRGGKPGDINAWETSIANLRKVHERLQDVNILKCGYCHLMARYSNSGYLIYLDPPYLPETRVSKKAYKHEMSCSDHELLLDILTDKYTRAKIIISGYKSSLYHNKLTMEHYWNYECKIVKNDASQSKTLGKRTEYIWKNF